MPRPSRLFALAWADWSHWAGYSPRWAARGSYLPEHRGAPRCRRMLESNARADRPSSNGRPGSLMDRSSPITTPSFALVRSASCSDCICPGQDGEYRSPEDFKIEGQRPIFDIVQIVLDPLAD